MLSTALLERKLADCFLHTHALQTQANPHTAPVRCSGRPEPGQAGGRQRPSGEAEGGEPRTAKKESRHGALAAPQPSGDRPRPRIADLIACAPPHRPPTPFSSGTGPLASVQPLSRYGASAGCPIMHWAILIRARCPITLSPVSLSLKTVYISTHSVHSGSYWKTQQLTHVRYTNWSGIYGTRGEAFPELCQ